MCISYIDDIVNPKSERSFVSSQIDFNSPEQRWTEARNPRSINLSGMSMDEAISLFHDSHNRAFQILQDPRTYCHLIRLIHSIRTNPPERIIFGGAGSSGRIALLAAHDHYDSLIENRGIELMPWMVGGAQAVARTAENAEDRPDSLLQWLDTGQHEAISQYDLIIGISCGASAPSVAGALQYGSSHGARTSLLANNPFALAPDIDVEGLQGGMKSVLDGLHDSNSFYPLPALYGAELLSGSTRLNGGSTTWILLDTLFSALCSDQDPLNAIRRHYEKLIHKFEKAWEQNLPLLRESIAAMTKGLQNDESEILFMGSENAGRVCVLDASEHPPTFGVPVGRVHASVAGGWRTMLGIFYDENTCASLESAMPISGGAMEGFVVSIQMPNGCNSLQKYSCEDPIASKMILNTISTIAYAHAGYVDGNIMVNMVPSNVKLIKRAISIIDKVTGCGAEAAEKALRLSILGENGTDDETHSELALAAKRGDLPNAIALVRASV